LKDKTMTIEVRVPTLGESVTEATVATWFKKPGDAVAVDEMLCELETDKVTVEVSAPAAGTLGEIVAAEGETVGADALLATLTEGTSAAPAPKAKAASAKEAAPAASGKSTDVMVPTLGESVSEATVSTWFKKVGDTVTQDEMLCELETRRDRWGKCAGIRASDGGGTARSVHQQGRRRCAVCQKDHGRQRHRSGKRPRLRPRRAHHERRRAESRDRARPCSGPRCGSGTYSNAARARCRR
jgi:biotin carboxyl carrier protein